MIYRVIKLFGVATIVVAAVAWWCAFNSVNPLLTLFPPPEAAPPPAAFDRLVESVVVTDEPLIPFLKSLAAEHGLTLVIDEMKIQEDLISPEDTTLRLELRNVRLREVFEAAIRQVDPSLVVVAHDGRVTVTTEDGWYNVPSRHVTAVYPINDLLAVGTSFAEPDLATLIMKLARPTSWDGVGGHGHCEAYPGSIVVSQTPDVHQQIESLLADLASDGSGNRLSRGSGGNATFKRLQKTLEPTEFVDASLTEAVQFLGRQAGVNVVIDRAGFAKEGLDPDVIKISLSFVNITYEEAYRWLLENIRGSAVVQGSLLYVTTNQAAFDHMAAVRIYDIRDLLRHASGLSLQELVVRIVEPASWEEVGGNADISVLGGKLAVLQTPAGHDRVREFLEMLHRAPSSAGTVRPNKSEMYRKIQTALREPSALTLADASLGEIGSYVEAHYQFNVEVVGVPLMKPMNLRPAATLHDALVACMREYDGQCIVVDGTLLLTTDESYDDRMEFRVFPLHAYYDACGPLFSGDALSELVTEVVAQEHWADWGGEGDLSVSGRQLVVRASQRHIKDIELLSEGIEEILAGGGPDSRVLFGRRVFDESSVLDALDRRVDKTFLKDPMSQFAEWLRADRKVPTTLDRRKRDKGGVRLFELVTGEIKGARLRSALGLVLSDMKIHFTLADNPQDGIYISRSRSGFDDLPETRIYRIADLSLDADYANALSETLPELGGGHWGWTDYGGDGIASGANGILVVRHTDEVHRRVESLLSVLRTLREKPDVTNAIVYSPLEAERRVQVSLDKPIETTLFGETLATAFVRLADEHDLPLWISPNAQELLDADDAKRYARFENVRLGTVLDLMAEVLNLQFTITFEHLVLAPPDTYDSQETCLYPIGDLDARSSSDDHFQPLAVSLPPQLNLLVALLRDSSIPFIDSPKFNVSSPVELGDCYLIAGPRRQHDEIREALQRFRTARASTADGPLLSNSVPRANHRVANQNLRRLLLDLASSAETSLWIEQSFAERFDDVRASCDVLDEPLDEAIRELSRNAVSDAGSPPEFKTYLDRGVWFVASPEVADQAVETRMYRLSSGWLQPQGSLPPTDVLKMSVEPFSWGDLGGGGSLYIADDIAIVTQTSDAHAKFARLLETFDGFPRVADPGRQMRAKDPLMRAAAQMTLAIAEKSPANAEILIESLAARNLPAGQRFRICYALQQYGAAAGEAAPLLHTLLRESEDDWRLRIAYCKTLVSIGPSAEPFLLKRAPDLKYDETQLLFGEARALKQQGAHFLPALLKLQAAQNRGAISVIAEIDPTGAKVAQILAKWRADEDPEWQADVEKLVPILKGHYGANWP